MPRVLNSHFYAKSTKKHGFTPKGMAWLSRYNQEIRFKTLLELIPDNLDEISLADAGCGCGDLYFYMQKQLSMPKAYCGIELFVPSYNCAKKRIDAPLYNLDILKDPLPSADYYLCSGAMNLLTRFETYLFIRRCYEASTKGFVFNLLKGDDQSMIYNYFLPKEIKHYAKELKATCKIVEGYLEDDFSVLLIKDR